MYRIFYRFLEILVETRPRPRPRQFRSDPAPAKYWTRSVHRLRVGTRSDPNIFDSSRKEREGTRG